MIDRFDIVNDLCLRVDASHPAVVAYREQRYADAAALALRASRTENELAPDFGMFYVVARELEELTKHTYMDPVTGQRFRLEITSGPVSIPRSAVPFSPGEGVKSEIQVVSQLVMKKVAAQ